MAENKKTRAQEEPSSFAQFVQKLVDPLSRAFAETPLMQLRVRTRQGSITLVKSAKAVASHTGSEAAGIDVQRSASETKAARSAHLAPVPNGEAGRTYTTINAEVVGIFRDLPQPPTVGDKLENNQILGHIEALRLRNQVRCPIDGTLVAQVVVEGQPVDFGEALFVVDTTSPAVLGNGQSLEALGAAESDAAASLPEAIEPPRV